MSDLPNYLPGIPPEYGVKQPSIEVAQGTDVIQEFTLYIDDTPLINPSDWILEVFVKKNNVANNILWKGELNSGLFQKHNNLYYFRIPHDITALFLPGTYYFVVRATQKPGKGLPHDRMLSIYENSFAIDLNPASPNPKLNNFMVQAQVYDPIAGRYIITTESTEPTEPQIVSLPNV